MIRCSSRKFSVFIKPLDLAECRTSYLVQREEAAANIDTITDLNSNASLYFCDRDYSGKYEHTNRQCPANSLLALDLTVCPFEQSCTCND
jgi:hypothetical protein